MEENFGGKKLWWIWQTTSNSPKFLPTHSINMASCIDKASWLTTYTYLSFFTPASYTVITALLTQQIPFWQLFPLIHISMIVQLLHVRKLWLINGNENTVDGDNWWQYKATSGDQQKQILFCARVLRNICDDQIAILEYHRVIYKYGFVHNYWSC